MATRLEFDQKVADSLLDGAAPLSPLLTDRYQKVTVDWATPLNSSGERTREQSLIQKDEQLRFVKPDSYNAFAENDTLRDLMLVRQVLFVTVDQEGRETYRVLDATSLKLYANGATQIIKGNTPVNAVRATPDIAASTVQIETALSKQDALFLIEKVIEDDDQTESVSPRR